MVNNSYAQGKFQALLEIHQENDPGEQSSDRDRNPDRGSCNEVPGGWESLGDDGLNVDDHDTDHTMLGAREASYEDEPVIKS